MKKQFFMILGVLLICSGVYAESNGFFNSVQVGGYFGTEWVSNATQNDFRAHRFVLNVMANPHDRLVFYSEIEMEYGALINAGTDDGEIKIEQAYLDFLINDAFNFRGGIVLVPFGYVNRYHDSDMRDTVNRPLMARTIIPTTWSDTGVGFYGEMDLEINSPFHINYEVYMVNGLQVDGVNTSITTPNGIRSARPGFKSDNNRNKALVGRLGISPWQGFEIGTNFYTGNYDNADSLSLTILGFDGFLKHGPFEYVAEWAKVTLDGDPALIPVNMNGYYIEGRYHFFPAFLKGTFLANGFTHPIFTFIARYAEIDADTATIDENDKTRWTAGLNYRPIESMAFKFEFESTNNGLGVDSYEWLGAITIGF